jgi:hypothetical protein
LTNSGLWLGSLVRCQFDSSAGFIALPYNMQAILGVSLRQCPAVVFSEFHQFTEVGPGLMDETLPTVGVLTDMGENFATVADPTEAAVVRLYSTIVSDAGKQVRIYGTDANGLEILDTDGNPGERVTLTAFSADSWNSFLKVTDVMLPADLKGAVRIFSQSATPVQLDRYQPCDIRPRRRRYQMGTWSEQITVLCRRQHINVRAETDWVTPSNMGGLKKAIKAIMDEDASNDDAAAKQWASAYSILNAEMKAQRGSIQYRAAFQPYGPFAGNIPNSH